jgi:hypothetical protein
MEGRPSPPRHNKLRAILGSLEGYHITEAMWNLFNSVTEPIHARKHDVDSTDDHEGMEDSFNKPFGTSDDTICEGSDSRLSDAREPTAHHLTHEDGGTDEVSVSGLSGELVDEQKSAWAKVSGKPTEFDAGSIKTVYVAPTTPTAGQALVFNDISGKWEPATVGSSSGGDHNTLTGRGVADCHPIAAISEGDEITLFTEEIEDIEFYSTAPTFLTDCVYSGPLPGSATLYVYTETNDSFYEQSIPFHPFGFEKIPLTNLKVSERVVVFTPNPTDVNYLFYGFLFSQFPLVEIGFMSIPIVGNFDGVVIFDIPNRVPITINTCHHVFSGAGFTHMYTGIAKQLKGEIV